MIVLNFAHPITPAQQAEIERLTNERISDIRNIPTQFDIEQPFAPQARHLCDAAELSPEDWQNLPLLVSLPSLNVIAAALLAEIHGRSGYFPSVLRLKLISAQPPRFAVAEILPLQVIRDVARTLR